MSHDLKADLELALRIAKAADHISMSRFMSQDLVIETKPDTSPVTDADKAVEREIRDILLKERPDDGIVGEEFGSKTSGRDRYWVIDPIDGTKSFLRGFPVWSTLIALVVVKDNSSEVVLGVVSSPALLRNWYAIKNGGAFTSLNGKTRKISVSKVNNLKDAQLGYSDFEGWGTRLPKFRSMIDKAWRSRAVGDFWSHMLVAEGVMDVAVEPSLKLWDMAPLDIIVKEAGGEFSDLGGNTGPWGESAISSNGLLTEEVLKLLNE